MTTKQIAEAVGQTDRSVRNWVAALAEKSSVIAEKLAASSSRYPADYTLDESCQIIEQGLGAAAADVYRTNAVNAEMAARQAPSKAPRLPSGAQLRELRLAVEKGNLSKDDFRRLLGLGSVVVALAPPERPATPAEGEVGFRKVKAVLGLPPGTVRKVAGAAAAAAAKTLKAEEAKASVEAKSPFLPGLRCAARSLS